MPRPGKDEKKIANDTRIYVAVVTGATDTLSVERRVELLKRGALNFSYKK